MKMQLLKVSCIALATLFTVSFVKCSEVSTESPPFNGKQWAVLVAGSNGYSNYRHQADVCHAYQVLKSHGVPEDQIIVMMYDDIAHSKENPTPGIIINHPKGKDVYQGVPKHYTRHEVTPDNFISVLLGNESLAASGKKVLASGPDDHVFVYFADHGAPGLLAFPSDELLATRLIKTLRQMNDRKMFKHLVFYIEACESGSMFEKKLPSNINVFAVTAANGHESSYACYYDNKRETFLGDVFSVEWIEESEKRRSLDSETVDNQYRYLVRTTNTSHVMEFGDVKISRLPLGQFQGEASSASNSNEVPPRVEPFADAVPSHDVPLIIAQRRAMAATDPIEKSHLTASYRAMINARTYMKSSIQLMSKKLQAHGMIRANSDLIRERMPLTRTSCYETLYKTFDEHCFDLSTHPHSLRFLYVLVNACENLNDDTEELVSQLAEIVTSHCTSANLKNSLFRSIS